MSPKVEFVMEVHRLLKLVTMLDARVAGVSMAALKLCILNAAKVRRFPLCSHYGHRHSNYATHRQHKTQPGSGFRVWGSGPLGLRV